MNPTARSEFARLIAAAIQDLRAACHESAEEAQACWAIEQMATCLAAWQASGEAAAVEACLNGVDEALRRGMPVPILLQVMANLPDRLAGAMPSDAGPDLQAQRASCERFARHMLVTCSEHLLAKHERQRATLAAQGRELGELMRLARDSVQVTHPEELPPLVLAHVARAFRAGRGIAWLCHGEGQLNCISAYLDGEGVSLECFWLPGAEEMARQALLTQRPMWQNGPDESSLHLPLLAAGRPLGALSLYRKGKEGAFHKRDLLLAQSLSSLSALVLSHANLIEASRHQAERAIKQADATARLSGPKSLDEVLQIAADCLREMLIPDGAALITLREEAPLPCQRLAMASFQEVRWSPWGQGQRDLCLSMETEPFKTLSRSLAPIAIEDLPLQAPEFARATTARSALVMPLLDGGLLIGTLGLLARHSGGLEALDMALAKSLTDRITATILSARLLEETRRRTQEIETLYEAAQDISRQRPELGGVLDRLLHRTLGVLGGDRGFVILLQGGRAFIPAKVAPPGVHLPVMKEVNARHEIFQQLAQLPGPLQVTDSSRLPPEQYPLLRSLGARSLLLIPMFLEERMIGGIAVGTERERRFDESDRHLASSLAYLGALAVRTASYFADLEQEVAARTGDLAEANRQLQLLDQMRRNLLANVTHELRTPLSGILGYGEILEEELGTTFTDEQRSFMHELLSEGYHLRDLINTMIDMSQLASGTLVLDRQPVSFELLTRQVCEHYTKLAQAKGIAFACDSEKDLPYVDADPSRAYQVLGHLLTNALKFTPAGGHVSLRVKTELRDHRPMVSAEVRDTGIGIPAEKFPLLFTSFFQADPSATREFGGMGLGLSLSKHLVELHGGTIWAESTEGQGSTFGFTLPVWQESDHPGAS